jgi:hypothetical protein
MQELGRPDAGQHVAAKSVGREVHLVSFASRLPVSQSGARSAAHRARLPLAHCDSADEDLGVALVDHASV